MVLNEERAVVTRPSSRSSACAWAPRPSTEQETVNEEVRKEHIEVEGDVDRRR